MKQVLALALRGRKATDTLLGGEVRSVFRGTGMEFTDVRPYVEGDDIRQIDWNLLARTGHPWIKLFTETKELTLLLVVDCSASTGVGNPQPRFQRAIEVAAILTLVAEQQRDRVGLLAFADAVGPVIPPGRGRRHAYGIVKRLFALQPGGGTALALALRRAGALLKRRSLVVVISDFAAKGWETPLRGLAGRHEVTAIVLEDPHEVQIPEAGWVLLEDVESGDRALIDSSSALVRDKVADSARRIRSRVSRVLVESGVREVIVSTEGDHWVSLRAAFGKGG